jgi:hypothetical protein
MATSKLELRIAALEETFERRLTILENEFAKLRLELRSSAGEKKHWLDAIYGSFANDPDYDKAMELGRKYREAQRPKPTKKKAKKMQSVKGS